MSKVSHEEAARARCHAEGTANAQTKLAEAAAEEQRRVEQVALLWEALVAGAEVLGEAIVAANAARAAAVMEAGGGDVSAALKVTSDDTEVMLWGRRVGLYAPKYLIDKLRTVPNVRGAPRPNRELFAKCVVGLGYAERSATGEYLVPLGVGVVRSDRPIVVESASPYRATPDAMASAETALAAGDGGLAPETRVLAWLLVSAGIAVVLWLVFGR